ncbi:type II secretion system protein GspL [Pseudomonas fakonensis]|uniref:Type II secretion system protein GspL n=1 Tax=Pseudomonas fakonensis TaxID=2842355 RepID=A0ABX8N0I1_9PSED|nr:type II secretion system protein GspL [Pseudomonas fakonensis]QXH49350.1 type II secretion system protein GspL [Pseudomonas fakonensis]
MNAVLHIQLPPLTQLTAGAKLDYRLGERHGQADGAQLARDGKGASWCLHLHADDSLALRLPLPPLAGKRLDAAVRCAVQGLLLGEIGQVHVAHGPRQADGQVAVAWLGQAQLAQVQAWLGPRRVRLGGLFSQPSDDVPAVDLAAGLKGPAKAVAWGRTAAVWALAAALWCLGLNLYAARLAGEGEQLRAQMVSQVRQAFPQLPVVLNPLQQARQQLQGGQGPAAMGLARLLEGAGQSMPFLAGEVAALDYVDATLRITRQADSGQVPAASAWQADLAARGIEASVAAQGWTLRAAKEELAHVD